MEDKTKIVKYIVQSNDIPTLGVGYKIDEGGWVSDIAKATNYDLRNIPTEYLLDDKYQIVKVTTKYKVAKLKLKGM